MIAAVGVGIGVGIVIGLLTAYGGGSPFIITLGMGTVVTGLNYTLTGGTTIFDHISGTYIRLGRGELLGFRYHVWVALVVLLVIYVIHDRTEVGRYMRAVGGNARTALLSGLNVRRLRLYGFVIVGICAAIAGILITASAGTSTPQDGLELLLPAYAAAFIGSASFRPGTFNVFGTAIGILFLAVLQNGLTLMSAQTSTIYLIQGSILIIAVLLVRLGGPVRYQSHV